MSHSPALPRRRTTLRIAACAALGVLGAMTTAGCLLALFLAHLSLFGERPQTPWGYTLLLLAGAAAGIGVPLLVTVLALDTWRRRLMVAAIMPAVLLPCGLFVVSVMGV